MLERSSSAEASFHRIDFEKKAWEIADARGEAGDRPAFASETGEAGPQSTMAAELINMAAERKAWEKQALDEIMSGVCCSG